MEMMRKIGLFINDVGFENKNFTSLEKGNPGVGGTPFEFVLLAHYLSMDRKNKIIIFHCNDNEYPEHCESVMVSNFEESLSIVAESDIDVFILQANLLNIVELLMKYEVKAVLWAHNYLRPNKIIALASCEYVRKIVCVGKMEYYITRILTKKAKLIYNMVSPLTFEPEDNRKNVITYIGSLVPPKGFHILAKEWPLILKEVPDAELYVIGSGQLYCENTKLGRYGIAEEEYEELIMDLLKGDNGQIYDKVHFCGNMGIEKIEIIKKTLIGVVNPSGKSETFGISALDFNGGVSLP